MGHPQIRIDHCVIASSDLARSDAFYSAVLGAEITAPQCLQVGLGNEDICCTESPLGVAIVNGRDTQATQFQHSPADVTVVPQGIVEGLEARP